MAAGSRQSEQPASADRENVEKTRLREDDLFVSAWEQPTQRPSLLLSHQVTRHDGLEVNFQKFIGQPMVVSFAYTRCTNPNKCQLVTTTMAQLRKKLQQAGLLPQVKLVLITYDSEWDTPTNLRDYSQRHGLDLDEHTLFLRPAGDSKGRLYHDLKVTASFNATGVALHGIQMLLIDKAGRLARTYRLLIWDNDQVLQDLVRLVNE